MQPDTVGADDSREPNGDIPLTTTRQQRQAFRPGRASSVDTSGWWELLPWEWIGASAKQAAKWTGAPMQDLRTEIALGVVERLLERRRTQRQCRPIVWRGRMLCRLVDAARDAVINHVRSARTCGLTGDAIMVRTLTRAALHDSVPVVGRASSGPRLTPREWRDFHAWLARVLCRGRRTRRRGQSPLAYKVLEACFRGESLPLVAGRYRISEARARELRLRALYDCRKALGRAPAV